MTKQEEYLLSIVKYQQTVIDRYKEYIENMIHKEIIESIPDNFSFDTTPISIKRIQIPETTFAIRCDPLVLREWEWLRMDTPIMAYDKIAFIAQEIKNNEIKNS